MGKLNLCADIIILKSTNKGAECNPEQRHHAHVLVMKGRGFATFESIPRCKFGSSFLLNFCIKCHIFI